jgi:hypothetical protein
MPPANPIAAVIDAVLDIPGPEAIRRVYTLSVSAARARARLKEAGDRLDARAYHAVMAATPEARFADELIAARRELDMLAQERRRLDAAARKAREAGRGDTASMHELQSAAATMAMEAVAAGTLLFLGMPQRPTPAPLQPVPPSPVQGGLPP